MKLEKIVLFETSLDHLTGEELGQALNSLNEMDIVLDAIFLTGIGKKNRPSGLLQVLCLPEHESATRDAIFRHTHTLGLRRQYIERYVLPRSQGEVSVSGGSIPAKIYEINGQKFARPEADQLARIARKHNQGTPALRITQPVQKQDF